MLEGRAAVSGLHAAHTAPPLPRLSRSLRGTSPETAFNTEKRPRFVRVFFLQNYIKTLLFCRQSRFSKKLKTVSAYVQQAGKQTLP